MEPSQVLAFPRAGASAVSAALYPCGGACRSILYAHLSGGDEADAAKVLAGRGVVLCALSGEAWEADLSPWAAPRAFRKGKDFSGGAPAYLDFLCRTVLPAAEEALALCAPRRGIAGYSLAGLFSVYALYCCDKFNIAASMSGSLWYDGFAEWMTERTPPRLPEYVYLSLGSREPKTRDARMAAVGACTEAAVRRLADLGVPVDFAWEQGGHFQDISARCARGIACAAEHFSL
jgi:predicted alpha/beta superfamily hydrolase